MTPSGISSERFDRYVRVLAAACALALVSGCSGGAGAAGAAPASAPQASGDGLKTSFAFVFDGEPASGRDTDMLQLVNVVRHKAAGVITFELNDITHYPAAWPHLHFTVADHGTTTIRGTADSAYAFTVTGGNDEYRNDEMTVTITSNTAARVTGTFAGRVIHVDDGKPAAITDGRFDLPYATRSK
jgi:hypothetical protein